MGFLVAVSLDEGVLSLLVNSVDAPKVAIRCRLRQHDNIRLWKRTSSYRGEDVDCAWTRKNMICNHFAVPRAVIVIISVLLDPTNLAQEFLLVPQCVQRRAKIAGVEYPSSRNPGLRCTQYIIKVITIVRKLQIDTLAPNILRKIGSNRSTGARIMVPVDQFQESINIGDLHHVNSEPHKPEPQVRPAEETSTYCGG
jgi:hypothetical protein